MDIITSESKPLDLTRKYNFMVIFIASGVWEQSDGKRVRLLNLYVEFTGEGGRNRQQVKDLHNSDRYWSTGESYVTVAVARWEK